LKTEHTRNFIVGVVMATLSIVLVLIAFEIGLRTYMLILENKIDTQDVFRAYTKNVGAGRMYGFRPDSERLKTNSWGFRDIEFNITKDEGEKRIIMLGDSITAATELPRNETVSVFLEKDLRQTTKSNYTVYNLGVTGYNVSQSLATLNEVGLKLSPDLVVLNLCLNDSDPTLNLTKHGLMITANISGFSDINLRTFIGSSYALTFIKKKLINLAKNFFPDLINTLNNPKLFINKRVSEQAWSVMKAEILKIRDIVAKNDADYLVVIYPYASQVDRPVSELLPQRDLKSFFDSSGISFVDLINVYATAERSMFIDNIIHLNAYGTERIAQALTMEVISLDGNE